MRFSFCLFSGKSGQNRPIFTCMQVTCQSVGSTQQAPFCWYSSSLSTLFLLCTASKCVYILSVVVTSACPICAQACTTSTRTNNVLRTQTETEKPLIVIHDINELPVICNTAESGLAAPGVPGSNRTHEKNGVLPGFKQGQSVVFPPWRSQKPTLTSW